MFNWIQTWWRESRVVRKFRRDRAALVSLAIIGVFAGVFIWTAVTPLKTDYVNLQQQKLDEYKENITTLKKLAKTKERLDAEIGALLAKLKQKVSPKAKPKAKRPAPKKRPTPRVTPKAAKQAPASQPTSQPAPKPAVRPQPRPVAPSLRPLIDAQKAHITALQGKISILHTLMMRQKALSELELEGVMARTKLLQKKPAPLSWLQKYNADTGVAYANPSWLGRTEKEKVALEVLMPYMAFGGVWVEQSVLKGSRQGLMGTDRLGRDIFKRVVVSVNVAFKIGLVTALIACFIGLILGGMAGFFGGWIDLIITWIYSVFSSIPYIVLVLLIAAVFRDMPGLTGLYIAFGLTFWIGPARVVRGEVMKIKEMEYIQAARALGNSQMRILFRHVLPNTMHLIFVYFSLIFIGSIKSEVILTFLGLGVKNMPSWGGMISDASKEIIGGLWWQMIGASLALFLLVYAFNIFTDALQDALDPKHIK